MTNQINQEGRVKGGAGVAAMFYVAGEPCYAHCVVTACSPLVLACPSDQAAALLAGDRLMLVHDGGGHVSRGAATVQSVRESDGAWQIACGRPRWEDLDKRIYPRHDLAVAIRARGAIEVAGAATMVEIAGTTRNVSLGGALIDAPQTLAPGSLVEITLHLSTGVARLLGLVVRTEEQRGFAVQFIDFVGTSRQALRSVLDQAA